MAYYCCCCCGHAVRHGQSRDFELLVESLTSPAILTILTALNMALTPYPQSHYH